MITASNSFAPESLGLPSEREIETLAGSLFADFDPATCAAGIDDLVTTGNTAVINRAAEKVGSYSAGFLSTGEYEQIVSELSVASGELGEFAGVTLNEPGGSGIPGSYGFSVAESSPNGGAVSAPKTEKQGTGDAKSGYSPRVISQAQADEITPPSASEGRGGAAESAQGVEPLPSDRTVIGSKTLGQIRADFPILAERIHGNRLVWLDNGATTQRPRQVIDRLSYYYEHENSNVHRGVHELADRSTDALEKARETVAHFIGAPSAENIVFVRGTTEAINLVANAYVKQYLTPGDEIIVTLLEHHANIVPWQLVAEETGAVIKVAPIDESGQIILSEFEKLFTPRTKFASATQVSNALGTITPVAEMIQIAHRHGVRILIDGAQSVAHLPVNVSALDADFFVFSGHKIYSPTGVGVVYGKSDLLAASRPWQGGGNMIRDVTFERTIYNEAPAKFEAGTAAIAQIVGLGAALDYVSSIGIAEVSRWEHELTQYALGELRKIPGLHLIGNATNKAGVLSFVLDGHDIFEVGEYLNGFGIAVRSGHHCAQPVLRHYGLEGTVRPTLALYNTPEDVDALAKALRSLK